MLSKEDQENLKKLEKKEGKLKLYSAGYPIFQRNFTRDSLISGIIMKDSKMIKSQLIFCEKHQGTKKDPSSGEEKGKIHHEFPGVRLGKGLLTTYNACDTTALFLIAHEKYLKLTKDRSLVESQKDSIKEATNYILRHLKKGFFIESPSFSNASDFALKVTYWKDSEINYREDGKISYPVIYTLVHVKNLMALRSAKKILRTKKFDISIRKMKKALKKLINENKKILIKDGKGENKKINSDILQMLFFLEKKDLKKNTIKSIMNVSKELETSYGYLTAKNNSHDEEKDYHVNTIWPFEQALINAGANKFNLNKISKVSLRIYEYLNKAPELFLYTENSEIKEKGCNPQLWTIAAKEYFKKNLSSYSH